MSLCLWITERSADGHQGYRCAGCGTFVYAAPGWPRDVECPAPPRSQRAAVAVVEHHAKPQPEPDPEPLAAELVDDLMTGPPERLRKLLELLVSEHVVEGTVGGPVSVDIAEYADGYCTYWIDEL